ncbi:MAG: hypothetical protein U0414_41440 [Polyangiaceae bacterium]
MTTDRHPSQPADPSTPEAHAPSFRSGSQIALADGYTAEATKSGDRLDVTAPDGRVCLSIKLTPEGPRVEVSAAALAVTTTGSLSLSADSMRLAAKRDLAIEVGGDVRIDAGGEVVSRGLEQRIEATLGDVRIGANDDVRVDGERVLLNAPDAPALRRLERERPKEDG